MDNKGIVDKTINNECSKCGNCCGLFIPFTDDELEIIKEYVENANIEPVARVDENGNMYASCCFYDREKHKCNIYEVRPFACRDFMCNRKNWLEKRSLYESLAKYNSTESDKTIMATFDDLVYNNPYYILRYVCDIVKTENGIDPKHLIEILRSVNRLDLLEHFKATDENGNEIDGTDLLNL